MPTNYKSKIQVKNLRVPYKRNRIVFNPVEKGNKENMIQQKSKCSIRSISLIKKKLGRWDMELKGGLATALGR